MSFWWKAFFKVLLLILYIQWQTTNLMLYACMPFNSVCSFFIKQDCIPNMNFHDINLETWVEMFSHNIMEVDLYSLIFLMLSMFLFTVWFIHGRHFDQLRSRRSKVYHMHLVYYCNNILVQKKIFFLLLMTL